MFQVNSLNPCLITTTVAKLQKPPSSSARQCNNSAAFVQDAPFRLKLDDFSYHFYNHSLSTLHKRAAILANSNSTTCASVIAVFAADSVG